MQTYTHSASADTHNQHILTLNKHKHIHIVLKPKEAQLHIDKLSPNIQTHYPSKTTHGCTRIYPLQECFSHQTLPLECQLYEDWDFHVLITTASPESDIEQVLKKWWMNGWIDIMFPMDTFPETTEEHKHTYTFQMQTHPLHTWQHPLVHSWSTLMVNLYPLTLSTDPTFSKDTHPALILHVLPYIYYLTLTQLDTLGLGHIQSSLSRILNTQTHTHTTTQPRDTYKLHTHTHSNTHTHIEPHKHTLIRYPPHI